MMNGFKNFILRGNVVDLAVGVVMGASFGGLVTALVKDIITPLAGALAKVPDFSQLFFTLNGSKFMYGDFLNVIISFALLSATIYFFIVLPINKLMNRFKKPIEATQSTKKCPECLSDIPVGAKRCAFCTSVVQP